MDNFLLPFPPTINKNHYFFPRSSPSHPKHVNYSLSSRSFSVLVLLSKLYIHLSEPPCADVSSFSLQVPLERVDTVEAIMLCSTPQHPVSWLSTHQYSLNSTLISSSFKFRFVPYRNQSIGKGEGT